eukprot:7307001-Heterocapsa_arctica.AAC.1
MWRTSPLAPEIALPVLVVQVAAPFHLEGRVDGGTDGLHVLWWPNHHQVIDVSTVHRAGRHMEESLW